MEERVGGFPKQNSARNIVQPAEVGIVLPIMSQAGRRHMKANGWYLRHLGWVPRPVRQVIVLVIGGTVLLIALLGIILPIMPGWIFLPLALAILALEFAWAARWLLQIRRTAKNMQQRVFNADEHSPWPARWMTKVRIVCVTSWSR